MPPQTQSFQTTTFLTPDASAGYPIVIGDHELLQPIAAGSYGQVWLARNALGTLRALKIVRRQTFEKDTHYEREFKGLQRFEPISRAHPGLVNILHLGRNDAEGYFYYVMELADAGESIERQNGSDSINEYRPRTLRNELATRGALPFQECISIALTLATALEHLHGNNLVHRDIKPSNIIFVNGVPKLADIGLVVETNDARSFVGTDGYIPPEGPGTRQADIYSFGKVLYEMSTGQDRHNFPTLPEYLAEADELLELNAVFLKCCKQDLSARYARAGEIEADLALLQRGRSVRRNRTAQRSATLILKAVAIISLIVLFSTALPFLRRTGSTPLDPLTTGKNVGGYPPTTPRGTTNIEAWNEYQRGLSADIRGSGDGDKAALEHYNSAIALDPNFALAYQRIWIAKYGDTWLLTHSKEAEWRGLAKKIVELDSDLAETHVMLGFIRSWEWKWEDAEREYRLALRLNSNCSPASVCLGLLLSELGRPEEAREVLNRALRLNPTFPQLRKMIGHTYYVERNFAKALEDYRQSYNIEPNFSEGHRRASIALVALKNYREAINEWEQCRITFGGDPLKVKQECREQLDGFLQQGARGYWLSRLAQTRARLDPDDEPYAFAKIYSQLGQTNETFMALERAFHRHDELVYLLYDHWWDTWRDQAQFRHLIERVGLAPYEARWRKRFASGGSAQGNVETR